MTGPPAVDMLPSSPTQVEGGASASPQYRETRDIFLDKRFYTSPEWSFELREFAIDYIGMSRNNATNAGKIKEKLHPAINEFEETGFIEPIPREQRYTKRE